MLKKEAERITGGLSAPGKMPEGSYNIPASACQTGAILAKIARHARARDAMHSTAVAIDLKRLKKQWPAGWRP